ncbi:hypothetical protein CTI12_AA406760 [Artemisia annua]|uniref:Uncharacterized protein n=1 Tax=Artemisia annua TaxID=35608 RepID=A0A2U1M8P2_ARTAN|nr:hypothetical protein CTI12_AA406760 [Artemisia annua]
MDALRAEVNISNDENHETIDLDEMEDSFGNLKPSKSFGPIDRFAKVVDKGKSKQANLSNVIRKEQMNAYKEYICRWAYESIGGLTRYKKTLDQAKTLTVFIYAHHKTLALMRQFTKKRDIVRPGVTRFASGFLTLQSLAEKKSQLRNMFCSEEWEKCKFAKTVKGKTVYALVLSAAFWAGVTTCLKVFAPLVKVLRMVDADWKPSMGFIYGELRKATQEIKGALNDNENAYKPVLDIINGKSSNRLDTFLHKAAYILNPYYYYYDPLAKLDVEANDSIVEILGVLFPGDYELQNHINMVELPMYKNKLQKFDRPIAIKACAVNNELFDPANANLMESNKKRKARNHELLLGEDASEAQEWIVDGDDAHWEAVSDALGVEDELRPRTSARRKARELFEDDFVSGSEEEIDEEVEYESDDAQIKEQYGQDDN